MSQHCLILQGHIFPPILPSSEIFRAEPLDSIFIQKGADFEVFREKVIHQWHQLILDLLKEIERERQNLRIGFFVGGPTLLWLEQHAPAISAKLDVLNQTGAIEWICGPMDHSLRFLYHRAGLEAQVYDMQEYLLKRFGQRAKTLALPYFFYNTYFGYLAKKMGMQGLLVPPRPSSTLSMVPHSPSLTLIHTHPWGAGPLTQTEDHQIQYTSIQSLAKPQQSKSFFGWLSEVSEQSNWVLPSELATNGTPPAWDIQELITTARPLGSSLEALSHPYCQNWLKHLEALSRADIDMPQLHHSTLFEAMLGRVEGHNPTEVYRSLLMKIKKIGMNLT